MVAALFFVTYEGGKMVFGDSSVTSIALASMAGETVACGVRVPVEVLKQRTQAGIYQGFFPFKKALRSIIKTDGWGGFYRGFGATLQREIPFAAVQFPLYERFKTNKTIIGLPDSVCGSIAGGVTAFITTPLDVIKTRIMLADRKISYAAVIKQIYSNKGILGFWAGGLARVSWISLGGFVFFGSYEGIKAALNKL